MDPIDYVEIKQNPIYKAKWTSKLDPYVDIINDIILKADDDILKFIAYLGRETPPNDLPLEIKWKKLTASFWGVDVKKKDLAQLAQHPEIIILAK